MIDSFLYLDLNRIKTEIESSFYVYASQRRRYIIFREGNGEILEIEYILDEENGNRENDEEDENIEDDSTSSTDEEES